MASNAKKPNADKTIAEVPKKNQAKIQASAKDQDIVGVAMNATAFLQNVQGSIVADEAARDISIDQMEKEAIAAHMKMLEDHSIPIEKREMILEKYYERIDKKRQYEDGNKKENSKRWNAALWTATVIVLGAAALKYAPDIINACLKNRRY